MLSITHTTPKRVLSHLRRLSREGDAILASRDMLTQLDEYAWEDRLFSYLQKIEREPGTFGNVLLEDFRGIDLLAPQPKRTRGELDRAVRDRIARRLVTLAGVIEQVEALVEEHSGN